MIKQIQLVSKPVETELEKAILNVCNGIATKINEIIDVVNELQESVQGVVNNSIKDGAMIQNLKEQIRTRDIQINELEHRISVFDDPTYREPTISKKETVETPADNSEILNSQKNVQNITNWIGKVCRFWDDYSALRVVDVLSEIKIDAIHPYIQAYSGSAWMHCEPVRPDDDIIYRGE